MSLTRSGMNISTKRTQPLVLLAVVDDDLLDVVGEQVARGLQHEIELGVEHAGALRALALLARPRPRVAPGSRRPP